MATFKDRSGTIWDLEITAQAIKRVLSLTGLNLFTLVETEDANGNKRNPIEDWAKLIDDPVKVCDVAYAIIKPQADAKGLTDEQFGELLGGDVLVSCGEALEGSLRDFFSARHPEFARMLKKMGEVDRRQKAELSQRITDQILGSDVMLKKAHARLDDLLSEMGIDSSISGPVNSE